MRKLMFMPFGIGGGLLAGFVAKRAFEAVWGVFDDQEAPSAEHRDVPTVKLVASLALQGLVFSLTRGLIDNGARRLFERLTGSWPGDEQPEPK